MKFYSSLFIFFILFIPVHTIAQNRDSGSYIQKEAIRLNTNPSIIQNDTSICEGSSISLSLNMPSSNYTTVLAPGSQFEYSFITPVNDWTTTLGGWAAGNAPFGNESNGFPPEFNYNTFWPSDGVDGYDLFVRRNIDLTGYDLSTIHWHMGVDNGYVLYINGDLLGSDNSEGYTYRWEYNGVLPLPLLNQGNNVIAISLEDHSGLTAFDMMIDGVLLSRHVSILWSTGDITAYISVMPVQTTTYYVTVTDGPTITKDSITVKVLKRPTVDFDHDAYCAGKPTNFFNQSDTSNSGTVNYLWSFGDGSTSIQTNPRHTYEGPGSYKVTLAIIPETCKNFGNELSKTIEVLSRPAAIRYPSVIVGANEPVQLQSRAGISHSWVPSAGLNNPGIGNPTAFLINNQQYLVRITSSEGCLVTDTVFVQVIYKEPVIYIPTGFTPNNDGKNDNLRPMLTGIKKLNYFRVYNRLGNLVYQTSELNKGWNGTYNGNVQIGDVYVWIIDVEAFNGNRIRKKGTVILIR